MSENARIVRPAFLDKAQNQVREVQPSMVVDCAMIGTANMYQGIALTVCLSLAHPPSLTLFIPIMPAERLDSTSTQAHHRPTDGRIH